MDINISELDWRKSTASGGDSNCVEVAAVPGTDTVALRESDTPEAFIVTNRGKLAAFLTGAKNGEFDDLA